MKRSNKPARKRIPAEKEDEKLHKVLANRGLGSRREIEHWISEGRVKVNDKVATLGQRVTRNDRISVDGKKVAARSRAMNTTRILLYNKPEGEVCTRRDENNRPTVFDHLPRIQGQRWIVVGRLDINTAGLLLFTNDGDLANRLMHPSTGMERKYAVRIFGQVTPEMIENLHRGVDLSDGPARFEKIVSTGGEGANQWFDVVVTEGRNRLVRRLWESQNLQVSRLIRMTYGDLALPRYLRRGRWVELDKEELKELVANKITH